MDLPPFMMVVGLPVSSSSYRQILKNSSALACAATKNRLTFTALRGSESGKYFIPASLSAYCMVDYVAVRFFVGFLVFRLAKYFDFGKFQKTRLRLISSVWSTSRSLQRLLRDVACFGAGSPFILWCRRIASPSKDASGRHEP